MTRHASIPTPIGNGAGKWRGLPKPNVSAIMQATRTIWRNEHGKTAQLPDVLCVRHRQPHWPALVVLHRRRGAVHRPLPTSTAPPGLPRPATRRNNINHSGRPNSNFCTLSRSRCMTEYYCTSRQKNLDSQGVEVLLGLAARRMSSSPHDRHEVQVICTGVTLAHRMHWILSQLRCVFTVQRPFLHCFICR